MSGKIQVKQKNSLFTVGSSIALDCARYIKNSSFRRTTRIEKKLFSGHGCEKLDTDMNPHSQLPVFHATTILCVRKGDQTAIGGDGQVSMGNTVVKMGAKKIRRLTGRDIVAGFAGGAADAFTLFELFEKKIEQYQNNLSRAAVEMAREWRTDRMLRRLEALLIVADRKETFLISGTGDVIAPDDGIIAIGSGGNYALAAARGLALKTDLSAKEIVETSMKIAGDICVFTNDHITVEVL